MQYKPFAGSNTVADWVEEHRYDLETCIRKNRVRDCVLVGVLDACVPFYASLLIRFPINAEVVFCAAKSYSALEDTQLDLAKGFGSPLLRQEQKPPVTVELVTPGCKFKGKTVFIIDTILDTGDTLVKVAELVRSQGAAKVGYTVLVERSQERRTKAFSDHFDSAYIIEGEHIPDDVGFLVGFGLDLNRQFRHLPSIQELVFEEATA